jgi:hypothetical protein
MDCMRGYVRPCWLDSKGVDNETDPAHAMPLVNVGHGLGDTVPREVAAATPEIREIPQMDLASGHLVV